MAAIYYMEIDNFGTDNVNFRGEVYSFSWGNSNAYTHIGGGGGSEKINSIAVTRQQDKYSFTFFHYNIEGKNIDKVRISVFAEGTKRWMLGWDFFNVSVTHIQVSGNGNNTQETLTLDFSRFDQMK